jgi:excisionase family DNA binding protein
LTFQAFRVFSLIFEALYNTLTTMKTLPKEPIAENAVYDPREAARLLGLSPVTVERKIRGGEIKAARIGKQYRLLGRDLLELLRWETHLRELLSAVHSRMPAVPESEANRDIRAAIQEVRRGRIPGRS